MAFQKYTEAELFLFRQKDKRIMWQNIFSSLCNMYQGRANKPLTQLEGSRPPDFPIDILEDYATLIVNKIEKQYPTEEAEKTPKYKEEELNQAITDTEKRLTQLKNIKSGQPF